MQAAATIVLTLLASKQEEASFFRLIFRLTWVMNRFTLDASALESELFTNGNKPVRRLSGDVGIDWEHVGPPPPAAAAGRGLLLLVLLAVGFRATARAAGDRDLEVVVAVTTRPPVLNRFLLCRFWTTGL